jgi:dCMP deaminase
MDFTLEPKSPPSDDDYYMGVALAVRRKANCRGNRVGAVIIKEKRIIATGYNGVPEGMTNCLDGGCLRCSNPLGQFKTGTGYDICICVHAEQNALLSAARFGISVEGSHLYTTMQPCFGCAKEIATAKIEKVTYLHPWVPTHDIPDIEKMLAKEYSKIMSIFKSKQLNSYKDPVDIWAVSALRKKLS